MMTTTLQVKGMHCTSCEALIKEVLEEEGARHIKANHKDGTIRFEGLDPQKAAALIAAEGYEVKHS